MILRFFTNCDVGITFESWLVVIDHVRQQDSYIICHETIFGDVAVSKSTDGLAEFAKLSNVNNVAMLNE